MSTNLLSANRSNSQVINEGKLVTQILPVNLKKWWMWKDYRHTGNFQAEGIR